MVEQNRFVDQSNHPQMIAAPAILYAAAALLGLLMGSFASLVAHRLPRGEAIGPGRSRCPHCAHALGAADLVPLLSFALSRGKCRYCSGPVAWRYPLMEMATAVLFMVTLWVSGPGWPAIILGLLAVGLLIMTAIDLEHQIIPDQLTLWLAGLGLVYQALPENGLEALTQAGAGALAGLLIAWLLRLAFQRIKRREALGLGDVKFFAVAGLWTGLDGLADFMMISGLAGIVFAAGWRLRGGAETFPFGPALAIGLFGVMLLDASGLPQPLSLLMMR